MNDKNSVFHEGEQAVQKRAGVRSNAEKLGSRFVRSYLTGQHQDFYQNLSYILVGSVDESGRPWASILYGQPGFLSTPTDSTLRVRSRPFLFDPLSKSLAEGARLGFLGIDYASRRRNRMSGRVSRVDDDYFEVVVDQSFGNCPQYIQSRQLVSLPENAPDYDLPAAESLVALNERAKQIIAGADHFFIASYYLSSEEDKRHGVDVSHRGGRPGFVKILDDQTLKFPDFTGNNHFNTLGNIELNPVAGLLFIDFESGDLLYLSATVRVDWDSVEVSRFKGAQRILEVSITSALLMKAGLPLRWTFGAYSPGLDQTGLWPEMDKAVADNQQISSYQDYRVSSIVDESETIRSFYLTPVDGAAPSTHQAGQYLPIEVRLAGEHRPLRRTYTISNAPNGEYFRLSIKKEAAAKPGLPPGAVSSYLHDHLAAGSILRVARPRGTFVLEKESVRPVVLISAGVGITPLLSMLEQLLQEADAGSTRQLWFVHGAKNSAVQGFRDYLQDLAQRYPNLNLYTVYSDPSPTDLLSKKFNAVGHISVELLKDILPLDDYEYYYCGPAPFMRGLKAGLAALNIRPERIHYEYFGSLPTHDEGAKLPDAGRESGTVRVQFRRSAVEADWDPQQGTLLEFAESNGLSPDFSCRSGFCQSCVTPLVAGEVDYVQQPEEEPQPDRVLICCAIPRLPAAAKAAKTLVLDL
jgi:hypothetical protein